MVFMIEIYDMESDIAESNKSFGGLEVWLAKMKFLNIISEKGFWFWYWRKRWKDKWVTTIFTDVSSDRRKARKAYFTASSSERRVLLSAPLSKELRAQYGVKALPIRRDDEVLVTRGSKKGQEGKVSSVYRLKFSILVDKVTKEKSNGASVPIALHPSKVVITKLHLDKDRKNLIQRRGGKLE